MSTNTTSTSDRVEADSLTSSPAQEEGVQKIESTSPFMAGLPDPAVLTRLANEFFAALPGAAGPSGASLPAASPNEIDPRVPSGLAQTAVPDYQREMLSVPNVPHSGSVPGLPEMPSNLPIGALNEADFRAIAASLAGAVALVPQVPIPASPTAILSPSSPSLGGEKAGPWAAAPGIPPAEEMFSFPSVPAIPSSRPTAPPSGSNLAAAASSPADETRTHPWAAAPNFPNEVFSFPRVPGVSAPGVPEPGIPEQRPEQRVPEPLVS